MVIKLGTNEECEQFYSLTCMKKKQVKNDIKQGSTEELLPL